MRTFSRGKQHLAHYRDRTRNRLLRFSTFGDGIPAEVSKLAERVQISAPVVPAIRLYSLSDRLAPLSFRTRLGRGVLSIRCARAIYAWTANPCRFGGREFIVPRSSLAHALLNHPFAVTRILGAVVSWPAARPTPLLVRNQGGVSCAVGRSEKSLGLGQSLLAGSVPVTSHR